MSDSVRPHRRQPIRLPHPSDSPGKNTGVGCHVLLQFSKVKSGSEVAQSCPTLCDPMDCSPPGSSVHGIFQARVLEWGAITFSEPLILGRFKLFHKFENIIALSSEKALAPDSSTLAWKIPWTEERGGLQSVGSLRVGHN